MSTPKTKKRPGDVFTLGLDFTKWPLNSGETLTTTNARGSLTATAKDSSGADVTSTLIDSVTLDSTNTQVLVKLKGGTAGSTYTVDVQAPTTDDELLTECVFVIVVDCT